MKAGNICFTSAAASVSPKALIYFKVGKRKRDAMIPRWKTIITVVFPYCFSVKNILFFYSAEALICECLNLFSHTAMKVSRHVSTS